MAAKAAVAEIDLYQKGAPGTIKRLSDVELERLTGHASEQGWRPEWFGKTAINSEQQCLQSSVLRAPSCGDVVRLGGKCLHRSDRRRSAERLSTARGLELGHAEARRRYDQVSRVVPHLYTAQAELLQQLCPKWGGTFAQAHAFAQECAVAAPPGSLSQLVVIEAHLEHSFAANSDIAAVSYLARPEVREEIEDAVGRSVENSDFRPGISGPGATWSPRAAD